MARHVCMGYQYPCYAILVIKAHIDFIEVTNDSAR